MSELSWRNAKLVENIIKPAPEPIPSESTIGAMYYKMLSKAGVTTNGILYKRDPDIDNIVLIVKKADKTTRRKIYKSEIKLGKTVRNRNLYFRLYSENELGASGEAELLNQGYKRLPLWSSR